MNAMNRRQFLRSTLSAGALELVGSRHASLEACIEETKKNIAWVMRNQG
jgi:hypothetical protein